jgi:hypothetical protein
MMTIRYAAYIIYKSLCVCVGGAHTYIHTAAHGLGAIRVKDPVTG